MLRSTDGGQSWQSQALSTLPFLFNPEAIHFFNAQHGIMIGDRLGGLAQSYTTHDGGQSWTEASVTGPGPVQIEDVRMVSPTVAFIIGTQGKVFKTTDGGQTWFELAVLGSTQNWVDMEFFDPLNGILLNKIGQLFRTVDGGANWQLSGAPSQSQYAQMQFFDAANGYLNDPATGFFRTTNGGQSWQPVGQAITGPGGVFFFANPSAGWSAFAGQIFKTTDGGLSWWMQYNSDSPATFRDMHVAGNTGWLCGENSTGNGVLFKAVNNGGFGIQVESYPANVICSFETNTFTCLHDGATSIRWFVDDVDQGINNSVFVFQPPADGTYTIHCIAGNASQSVKSSSFFQPVTTDPILPFGSTLKQDSICQGDRARFVMSKVFGGAQYRIQVGSELAYAFTGSNIQDYHWDSDPLVSSTVFDFYVLFTYCGGWKKMDSITVHVLPVPDKGLDIALSDTSLCENQTLELKVVHPQPNIVYQPWVYNQPWGAAQPGGADTLTLTSNPLFGSGIAGVLAIASSACQAVLLETHWVTVAEVQLSFAVSTQTIGLGESLFLENTSPDSLSFTWRFTSTPPNSVNISSAVGQHPAPLVFSMPGTGFITLFGTTPGGCTDSLVKTIKVLDLSGLSTDWAIPQGIPGQIAIEMDSLGNIYGYNNGNAVLASRTDADVEPQGVSGVFYKYNRQGVLQWYNTFNDLDGIPQGAAVLDFVVDKAGNTTFLISLNSVGTITSFWLSSAEGEYIQVDKKNCMALVRYSPNGVFRWAHFIEPVHVAAGGISYSSFFATSLGVDTLGNIFLSARITNSQYPDHLYSSTLGGYIDTIPIASGVYYNHIIKIRPDGHFGWIKNHVKSVQLGPNTLFLGGAMLKPDEAGGCYLWLNAGGSKPYATELLRLDATGAIAWSRVWGLSVSVTNSNYIWVNDLQIGPDGAVYLLGSCSAPETFGTGAYFGTFPGSYIVKVSPAGVTKWARSVTRSAWPNSSTSTHALGLAFDGDRIHVLT
jgi:photosystem II stability/assembly factor-like uncharacterized protein